MTRQRNGAHAPTEFSDWLRHQPTLDSSCRFGFVATNIDYVWRNYIYNKYMLIEEKRYCILHPNSFNYNQFSTYKLLDTALHNSTGYYGFHLLEFENTNPEDGKLWIDKIPRTKIELLSFLSFRTTYPSYINGKKYSDL